MALLRCAGPRSLIRASLVAALAFVACRPIRPTVLATTSGPPPSAGRIDGSLQVQQGTARYSMTIAVPPGTADVTPELTVAYEGGSNGVMGVGFRLEGVSGITRCGAQIVSDGWKGGVAYDAGDRFCLNGQRLIAVGAPQGGSQQYRTQLESWQQVIANGTCGSGPCSFTVKQKNGVVETYGSKNGAAVLAYGTRFTGPLQGSVRAWLLDGETDPNGNVIAYQYTQQPTSTSGATLDQSNTGQVYLDSITYGAAALPADSRKIQFHYETRPDPLLQFLGGGSVTTNLRITQIATSIHPATCGGASCATQPVMTYGFSYGTAPTTSRSRLASVTQCAASGACLPPTTFQWTDGGDSFQSQSDSSSAIQNSKGWVGDFNGDGRTDVLVGPTNPALYLSTGSGFTTGTVGFEMANYPHIGIVDLNGDGLTDIYAANASQSYFYLSTGTTFTCANNCTAQSISQHDYLLFGDWNGDGMTDVIVAYATSGTVYLSNGTGLVQSGTISNVNLGQGTNYVADWNGDGRADVLSLGTQGGSIYLSTISNNTYTLGAGIPVATTNGSSTTPPVNVSGTYRWVADWNGDGIADLFAGDANSGYINYGTGNGGLQAGAQITGLNIAQGNTWVGDFNGDGLSDLYAAGSSSGTMYLGNGTALPCVSTSSGCTSIAQSISTTSSFVGDFNGDGLTDVFKATGPTSEFNWAAPGGAVPAGNQEADLLASVTDGYGGRTTLTWKPITDPSVYSDAGTTPAEQQAAAGGVLNNYNPVPLFPALFPAFPVKHVRSGQYVVASYVLDQASSVNATQPYQYSYSYFYQGARVNLVGRGFLGYAAITETDTQRGATTTTTFNQAFPYTGRASGQSICQGTSTTPGATCTSGASQLQASSATWACADSQTGAACQVNNTSYDASATQVFFVTPAQSIKQDLQLGSSVKTLYQFDAWGNLQLQSELGDTNSTSVPLYTCTSYFPPNAVDWTFGFAQYSKQTGNASCLTNISSWQSGDLHLAQYAYDSRGNRQTDVAWDDRNNLWFGTFTVYNAQGLAQTAQDMSGNPPAAVAATTMTYAYDTAFLSYPQTVTSPAPQSAGDTAPVVTTSFSDARFGVTVAQGDPNGNIRNTCVDDFGRQTISQGPVQGGGTASKNCVSASTYPYAPASFTGNTNVFTTGVTGYAMDPGAHRITQETASVNAWSGGATSVKLSVLDGMGRVVLTTWENDQGQKQGISRQYLDPELVQKNSLPAAQGATPVWVSYQYNALGKKTQISSPLTDAQGATSQVLTTITSSKPNTVTLVEAAGLSTAFTETATVQFAGSQARVRTVARGGGTTTFGYDGLGRLTQTATPAGVTAQITFDGLGHVVQRGVTGEGTRTFQYDSMEDLHVETDAKGQTRTFTYDNLHRVLTETLADKAGKTAGTITLTWDQAASTGYSNVIGRIATATVRDPKGQIETSYAYGYDGYSNRIEEDANLFGEELQFSTTFDPQGRTWTRTYPSSGGGARPQVRYAVWPQTGKTHTVEYAADGATFQTWATYSQYDPFGTPGATSFGNGSAEQAASTPEGQLASLIVTAAGGDRLVNRLFGWGAPLSLTTIVDCNAASSASNPLCAGRTGTDATDSSRVFTYGNLRLATAAGGGKTGTNCYDGAGNLTLSDGIVYGYQGNQVTGGWVASPPTSCTAAHGAGVFSGGYDANGNLQTRSRTAGGKSTSWQYAHGIDDQLLGVKRNGVAAAAYGYDHTGRRVLEVVSSADGKSTDHAVLSAAADFEIAYAPGRGALQTIYLIDSRGSFAAASAPWRSSAATSARFGLPQDASARSDTPVLYFHRDQVGSTIAVTGASGASYASVGYGPWGRAAVTPIEHDTFRPKLSGQAFDAASGLYHLGARNYDPDTGRFTTADSRLGATAYRQDAWNPYAYVLNDPVRFADPEGHQVLVTTVAVAETATDLVIAENLTVTTVDLTTTEVMGDAATQVGATLTTTAADETVGLGGSATIGTAAPTDTGGPGPVRTDRRKGRAERAAKPYDKRFARVTWRPSVVKELPKVDLDAASQTWKCPTCDRRLAGNKIDYHGQQRIDYDVDHTMMTHARRAELVQFAEQRPEFAGVTFDRASYINIYHDSLRYQCPYCNQSHRFEPTDFDEFVYTLTFAGDYSPYFRPIP